MPMESSRPDRPGWGIIDRYMPYATTEAREEAYENLRGLAQVLMRIDERLVMEEKEKQEMLQPPLL